MKYLADTNIFLEVILEQKNYASARAFLAETPGESLCVSDYSLHSIGLFLFKRGKHHEFEQMLEDLLGRLMVNVLSLQGLELTQVGKFAGKFNMDFDDAYQYAIADK